MENDEVSMMTKKVAETKEVKGKDKLIRCIFGNTSRSNLPLSEDEIRTAFREIEIDYNNSYRQPPHLKSPYLQSPY